MELEKDIFRAKEVANKLVQAYKEPVMFGHVEMPEDNLPDSAEAGIRALCCLHEDEAFQSQIQFRNGIYNIIHLH